MPHAPLSLPSTGMKKHGHTGRPLTDEQFVPHPSLTSTLEHILDQLNVLTQVSGSVTPKIGGCRDLSHLSF